ncbi:PH domain-containing protein [Paucibacter sp. B2R-40]|uniref:PH domain-containing protein n=1 Tax=Paucibacter sp. B2R-40 TaxID=2893554 RepID=UPI0021E38B7A|nr:PH domain-containing protein [Paucibacter sp. B2R-40]MCV2356721.1 PH domain-containing protein [Paucibacter sp. B2R-40]
MNEPTQLQRLHPSSWLFGIAGLLKQLLAPLVAVLILGHKDSQWVLWALPAMLALTLRSVLRARAFRYEVTATELLVREGVLDRSLRHIPLARIQNVTQRRVFLHRLFGVTELRLESAAGGKPEAVMKVLSMAAATQLEALLRGAPDATRTATAEDAPRVLFTMPLREVLALGLTSNRGKLMVAALFGAVMPSQNLRSMANRWSEVPMTALARTLSDDLHTQRWLHLAVLTVGLLLLGVVVLQLFSAAMALLKFYNFRLEQQGERLLSSSGLTTKTRAAVRLPRLQRWELSASWLQRRLKRCQLSVTVAGVNHDKGEDEKFGSFKELAPLATPEQAQQLLRWCLPQLDWQGLAWRPLADAGFKRRLLGQARWLALLCLALMTGNLVLAAPLAWSLLLGAGALGAIALTLHARAWLRFAAYAVAGDILVYRSGVFTRRWVIVSLTKLQSLRLYSSGLDRHFGLQGLQADTQGGSKLARALDMPYLNAAEAEALRAALWQGLTIAANPPPQATLRP